MFDIIFNIGFPDLILSDIQTLHKTFFSSVCHPPFRVGRPDTGEPRPVDEVAGQDLDRLRPTPQGPRAEVHDLLRRHLLRGRRVRS